MKRLLLITLMAAWTMPPILAQETCDRKDLMCHERCEEIIFFDTQASFPGGIEAFRQFLDKNIQWPKGEEYSNITGRVRVSFVVRRDGSITDVEIVEGLHPVFDAEVLRVVMAMPKWIPASLKGEKVPSRYILPIVFGILPDYS